MKMPLLGGANFVWGTCEMNTSHHARAFFQAAKKLSAQQADTRQSGVATLMNLAIHDVTAIGRRARAMLLDHFGAVAFPASRENDPPPCLGGSVIDRPDDNVVRFPQRCRVG
jgi:hypothetical protein